MHKRKPLTLAHKLMIGGSVTFTTSIILAFISLFSLYGKVDEGLDMQGGIPLEADQLLAKLALVCQWLGIIVFIAGVILFFVQRSSKK